MPAFDFSQLEAWAAVGLAFLGTFIWRFLGVMLADKVQPDSMLMKWVNAVAYAMVAGVMMLVLVFPTGVLATTELRPFDCVCRRCHRDVFYASALVCFACFDHHVCDCCGSLLTGYGGGVCLVCDMC